MPDISTSTRSPGTKKRGGFIAMPTPGGVPVRINVPAGRVVLPLRKAINLETLKIMSAVELY